MRTAVFNRDKFRELILYIAERHVDDPRFGDVKLNKILYFSDFRSYRDLGHAVTGARYQKLPMGPAPNALLPVRDELAAEGALRIEERPVGQVMRRVTVAQRRADTSVFTEAELALVDQVIEEFRSRTAAGVSDYSHERSPGWHIADMSEEIHYGTALISNNQPSEATVSAGRELATRLGW
jgi:antitoxin SocA-like protein